MNDQYAVIVAGGKGIRMNSDIPKQFLPVSEKPVLMRSIDAFHHFNPNIRIILIIPENSMEYWSDLCKEYNFDTPHQVFPGGKDRTSSVRNGLDQISGPGWVAIHDGVRPFVSRKIIHDSFFYAEKYGNAVAAVKTKDSLRVMEGEVSKAVNRELYRVIQTPQTFEVDLIKRAYEIVNPEGFSDDASVLEKYGERIFLFEGSFDNIKITTPEDLELAELILGRRKKK